MTDAFDRGSVWGLRAVCGLVVLLGLSVTIQADLSPREYRRMQREAPEELRIEVLGVHEHPLRERERESEVVVDAKVLRIHRTSARIHEGDVIKITYVHHRRERPVPGPGEPPLLERGKVYPAFLTKVERERIFKPAAGSFSFLPLEERRPSGSRSCTNVIRGLPCPRLCVGMAIAFPLRARAAF